jgi:uncharacterized protein YcnI
VIRPQLLFEAKFPHQHFLGRLPDGALVSIGYVDGSIVVMRAQADTPLSYDQIATFPHGSPEQTEVAWDEALDAIDHQRPDLFHRD